MPRLVTHSAFALLLVTLATACAGRVAPVASPAAAEVPLTTRRIVSTVTGRTVSLSELATAASTADVVFLGEQHDDEETHRAELAVLSAIGDRRGDVVLSLEMFERDVQTLVDAYLAGRISEADFRAQSRPWPNYGTDYRPLVELAKAKGWPVVASNVPRRFATLVSRRGLSALDSLSMADRQLIAEDIACPTDDAYYRNFVAVMRDAHGGAPSASDGAPSSMDGMMGQFYQAQCIKDETMAASIVAARAKAGKGAVVVHVTGAFHSDFGLGTVTRVTRRLPAARTVVISAVPVAAPATEPVAEYADRGQFIILALRVPR